MHERKTLKDYKLKHGDIVYLSFKKPESCTENGQPPAKQENATNNVENHVTFNPVELDEVDKILIKQDGLIEKQKDKFCRHGANAKCVHCTPIEPYDEGYMKGHNIKHASFHSYLRKMKHGIDK